MADFESESESSAAPKDLETGSRIDDGYGVLGDSSPSHFAKFNIFDERDSDQLQGSSTSSSSLRPSFKSSLQESLKAGLPDLDVKNHEVGPVEKDLFNNQLRSARMRTVPDALKQPWEKGFGAAIFGNRAVPIFMPNSFLSKSIPLPPIQVSRESDQLVKGRSLAPTLWKRPVLTSATLKIRKIDVSGEHEDPLKFRAIERWRTIVFLDLNSSVLGRQLIEYVLDGRAESLIAQTLSDALIKKSNSTLLKRSGAILKFVQFCLAHFKVAALSYRESWIYSYLCFLRTSKASPSSGKSFLEALLFAVHVIGIDVQEPEWRSSRVTGVADAMFVTKAPLHQADPLFVSEVRVLHHVLSNSHSKIEKVVAGFCLLDIYGTCRWSDPQRPVRVQYDVKDGMG